MKDLTMNKVMLENGNRYIFPEAVTETVTDEERSIRERGAATIDAKLRGEFGYALSAEAIERLATFDIRTQAEEYGRIKETIEEVTGSKDFQDAQLFYPNFPEEVMEKDDFTLYMNSLVYYFGQNVLGINFRDDLIEAGTIEEKKERLPLLETFDRKVKVINLATEQDLHDLMDNRMHGQTMSGNKLEELKEYASLYPDQYFSAARSKGIFHSKENLMNIVAHAVRQMEHYLPTPADLKNDPERTVNDGDRNMGHRYEFLIRDLSTKMNTTDVLRLVGLLSNEHVKKLNEQEAKKLRFHRFRENNANLDVSAKNMVIKLKDSREKKLITDMLAQMPDLYERLWENKDKWKKAAKFIGLEKAIPRVRNAFDNLCHNKKLLENGERIENENMALEKIYRGFKAGEDRGMEIMAFAKDNPGLFRQTFTTMLAKAEHDDPFTNTADKNINAIISSLSPACKGLDPVKILTSIHYLKEHKEHDYHVDIYKGGKSVIRKLDHNVRDISDISCEKAIAALEKALKEATRDTKDMGKVYIDPALADRKAPTMGERTASAGATLTFGSKIRSNPECNLVCTGIWWKGHDDDDIDVSVKLLDKNYKSVIDGHKDIAYYNLKGTVGGRFVGVHSGDFTSGDPFHDGKGAEELIVLDKNAMKEAGVKYAVMTVNGFSGSFKNVDDIRFIRMEKEGTLNDVEFDDRECPQEHPAFLGEHIEPSQIEESIRLNADARQETTMFYDVETDSYTWLDTPGEIRGIANIANPESQLQNIAAILRAENNYIPNMHELISAYVDEKDLVDDPALADTVFTAEPVDAKELGLKENVKTVTGYDLDTISGEFAVKQSKAVPEEIELERTRDMAEPAEEEPEKDKKPEKENREPESLDEQIARLKAEVEEKHHKKRSRSREDDDDLVR